MRYNLTLPHVTRRLTTECCFVGGEQGKIPCANTATPGKLLREFQTYDTHMRIDYSQVRSGVKKNTLDCSDAHVIVIRRDTVINVPRPVKGRTVHFSFH